VRPLVVPASHRHEAEVEACRRDPLRPTVAARKATVDVFVRTTDRCSRRHRDVREGVLRGRGEGGAGSEAAFEGEEKAGKEEVGEDEGREKPDESERGAESARRELGEEKTKLTGKA